MVVNKYNSLPTFLNSWGKLFKLHPNCSVVENYLYAQIFCIFLEKYNCVSGNDTDLYYNRSRADDES